MEKWLKRNPDAATGESESGTSATGESAAGVSVAGESESGSSAVGTPVSETPLTGTSATGESTTGTSATGTSATGTSASGASAIGESAIGESAIGESAAGTSVSETPLPGASATGTSDSDGSESGISAELPLDVAMMRLALEVAAEAAERGEVPVGAVVARGDEVLAAAANEREATKDPTAHAELLAIRRACETVGGWRLSGCTLYSTLEPCPMCAGAAHASRLSRIVFAAADPKAGYAGTLHDTPGDARLNHTIPVESGVLGNEASELLRAFFKVRRQIREHPPSDSQSHA